MSVRTLLRSIAGWLARTLDRWRVRRFLQQRLPVVRDALSTGTLALPPAPMGLRSPKSLPADEGSEYLATASPLRWLAGQEGGAFRLASTRVLPKPASELSVLRLDAWNVARPSRGFDRTQRERPPLSLVRPELFGVGQEATRWERAQPASPVDESLPQLEVAELRTTRLAPVEDVSVLRPTTFGLADDATPATQTDPVEPRSVMRMPRARASFQFRFTEPVSLERILAAEFHTPTESLEERLESYFDRPDAGAGEPVETTTNDEVVSAMDEVREQFQLRRGIGRAEMDDSELGTLEGMEGFAGGSMKTFTGLEFEALQPEPIEPLRLKLENPPVDMAPPLEAPSQAYAMLVRALGEFPPDGEPPPVPELPRRDRE